MPAYSIPFTPAAEKVLAKAEAAMVKDGDAS